MRVESECPHSILGTQVMQALERQPGDAIGPLDWLKNAPHETDASSDRLGWVGLEAARCRATPGVELNLAPLTHHRLLLSAPPPHELAMRFAGFQRPVSPRAESSSPISAVSAAWAGAI